MTKMERKLILIFRRLCRIRCKNILTVCTTFICFHLVLVIVMAGFGTSNRKMGRKSKANYVEDEMYKATTRKILQSNMIGEDSSSAEPRTCETGHMRGLKAVCGKNDCLRKLYLTKNDEQNVFMPRPEPIPPESMQTIDFMQEYLAEFHIYMLSVLTDLQWHHGVYGSVGELGESEGKLLSVMTFNIDLEAGEKLFVSGHFAEEKQFQIFKENMKNWSFFPGKISSSRQQKVLLLSADTENLGNRILHIHRDFPMELANTLLTSWSIPQFRIISINPSKIAASMIFHSIEKAACILRNGGLIVVDGINEVDGGNNSLSLPALRYFFQKHGVSSLKPFMSGLGKVYLCTERWYKPYIEYIKFNKLFPNEYLYMWKLVTTAFYGPEFTYFVVVRS